MHCREKEAVVAAVFEERKGRRRKEKEKQEKINYLPKIIK
jgi:hypothetical protein